MNSVIQNRREGLGMESGRDILNLLLTANDSDATNHLSDREIISDVFILMLAGN